MSENPSTPDWLQNFASKFTGDERLYFLDFFPGWLRTEVGKMEEPDCSVFLAKYEEAFRETLDKIQALPLNKVGDEDEPGRSSTRIGKTHFINIKSAVWTTTKYAGPVALAVLFSPALLLHIGVTIPPATIATGASAGTLLFNAFAHLQASELDTYQAVAAAIDKNACRVLGNRGASQQDIEDAFKNNSSFMRPTNLGALLDQLVAKKVLEKKVEGGVEQFFLAF